MEFLPIPKDRFNDVVVHLQETFFMDEPMCKSLNLYADEKSLHDMELFTIRTLNEGLSVMALSNDNKVRSLVILYVYFLFFYFR